jgi:hypothetical protein
VAQGVGPEFKPQYHPKEKKNKREREKGPSEWGFSSHLYNRLSCDKALSRGFLRSYKPTLSPPVLEGCWLS